MIESEVTADKVVIQSSVEILPRLWQTSRHNHVDNHLDASTQRSAFRARYEKRFAVYFMRTLSWLLHRISITHPMHVSSGSCSSANTTTDDVGSLQ